MFATAVDQSLDRAATFGLALETIESGDELNDSWELDSIGNKQTNKQTGESLSPLEMIQEQTVPESDFTDQCCSILIGQLASFIV